MWKVGVTVFFLFLQVYFLLLPPSSWKWAFTASGNRMQTRARQFNSRTLSEMGVQNLKNFFLKKELHSLSIAIQVLIPVQPEGRRTTLVQEERAISLFLFGGRSDAETSIGRLLSSHLPNIGRQNNYPSSFLKNLWGFSSPSPPLWCTPTHPHTHQSQFSETKVDDGATLQDVTCYFFRVGRLRKCTKARSAAVVVEKKGGEGGGGGTRGLRSSLWVEENGPALSLFLSPGCTSLTWKHFYQGVGACSNCSSGGGGREEGICEVDGITADTKRTLWSRKGVHLCTFQLKQVSLYKT